MEKCRKSTINNQEKKGQLKFKLVVEQNLLVG